MVIPDGFTPSCLVCYNGAEIWNGAGRIAQNAIDPDTAREIVSVRMYISSIAYLAEAASIVSLPDPDR